MFYSYIWKRKINIDSDHLSVAGAKFIAENFYFKLARFKLTQYIYKLFYINNYIFINKTIKSSKIHKSAKIFYPELVNIYGCKIGALTTIGPFVEIQKGVSIEKQISSHSFIVKE